MNLQFPLVPLPAIAFLSQYAPMNTPFAQGVAIVACCVGFLALILAAMRKHDRRSVALFGWGMFGSAILFLVFGLYVLAVAVLALVLAALYGIGRAIWHVFIENAIIAVKKPVAPKAK